MNDNDKIIAPKKNYIDAQIKNEYVTEQDIKERQERRERREQREKREQKVQEEQEQEQPKESQSEIKPQFTNSQKNNEGDNFVKIDTKGDVIFLFNILAFPRKIPKISND